MSSDESVLKVIVSYESGAAAKALGDVKLVPSGKKSGSNLRVPRSDGSNVEQMLAETIIPATRAVSNAPNAEEDVFKFMLLLLEHPIYQMFKGAADELKVDVNNPTAGDFLKVVKRFLSAATSSSRMGDNILRHLEMGIRKPRTMTPQRFLLRFLAMLEQAQYFEGIKPKPTEEEQKDWYFRAYPKSYRLDYKKMHGDKKDSMQAITSHMTLMHEADELSGAFKEKKPSTKDKSVTTEEKGTERRRRRHMPGHEKSNRSKKTELSADMHCPVHPHGDHTWGECSQNPENRKDKNPKSDKKREHRSSTNGKKKQEKLSSHHIEHQDDDSAPEEGEQEEESDSEESSNKRMKHSSHHNADGDDLSADVEELGIVDAYPDE